MFFEKKNQIYVISGFSGVGKGSLLNKVMENMKEQVELVKSCTTRLPRVEGEDYTFLSVEDFEKLNQEGGFLEMNIYNGNYYGTPRKEVERILKEGKNVVLEIDINGYKQILSQKLIDKENLHSLFIVSNAEELFKRLKIRNTEDMQKILKRMESAIAEAKDTGIYDFILENDDFDRAARQLEIFLLGGELKDQNVFDKEMFIKDAEYIVKKYSL